MRFASDTPDRPLRAPSSAIRPGVLGRLLLLAAIAIAAPAPAAELPFAPGERLTFELRWLWIPAGTAVLEVMPVNGEAGREMLHFRLSVRSNEVLDKVYMVRDRVDAFTDLTLSRSLAYTKRQHEGRTRRNVTVTFDWQRSQARYHTPSESRDPVALLPGTLDPLSVFYFARRFDLSAVTRMERPVTDGKKCVVGVGRVVARESIRLSNGMAYDTYRIEPDLKHIGGVFRKSPNAKIQLWVTADRRRIPVKIKSRVVVGSFIGELISAEGLRDS
jgi:hypothetical protein